MKILVQRVAHASVEVDGQTVGRVGQGLLAFLGCCRGDSPDDVRFLADKLVALRIFRDAQDRMNLSLADTGGAVLLVSQFTLYADTRKGNRPGFDRTGDPAAAEKLYESFASLLRERLGADRVATGVFAADMRVCLCNEGPVTIELCSDAKFPKPSAPSI